MLQYANPMAANCLALGKATDVSFVGLCHGVQTTLDLISRYCGVPKEEITYTCGGINHMDWFLRWSTRAATSTPRCAKSSSGRSSTRTRRSAARCSATSATS
jgi:alpha-galactosidase/6-phospho-beta-glucosidase family protein